MKTALFVFRGLVRCIPKGEAERNMMVRRSLLLACLIAFTAVVRAGEARPSTPAMKEQFHTVIQGQLEALRKGDYPGAYQFAAPAIRQQFPLEAFQKMVTAGYPVIAQNHEVIFGLAVDDGEKAVVNVRIVARNKSSVSYQYLLERHGKTWQIGGVYELRENAI